jgi:DNA polymerase III alpha subunit
MPAVALTDQCNLFAMLKFYRAALERGVQPIIGVDLLLSEPDEKQGPSRFTLLCQTLAGYQNLARLVSRAYLEGQTAAGVPLVDRAWLDRRSYRRPDCAVGRGRRRRRARAAARARRRRPARHWTSGSTCSMTASISNCSALAGPRSVAICPRH